MRKLYIVLGTFVMSSISSIAFAVENAADLGDDVKVFAALAAGFGIAFAAAFGALGQGKATAAALEGIARNPNAAPGFLT